MKNVILSFICLLSISVISAQEMNDVVKEEVTLNWESSFKKAQKKSKKEKKPILIYFRLVWTM